MERSLTISYAFDQQLQETANAEGHNYWYAYVEEILSRLGLNPKALPLSICADTDTLSRTGVLLLGNFQTSAIPPNSAESLLSWIENGGILIGFATEGLDNLFSISAEGTIPQEPDSFSISGYFDLLPSPITSDCRAPIDPDQHLLITASIRRLHCLDTQPLARLFTCDPAHPEDGSYAQETNAPVITHRSIGRGHAFYFSFDVAQTMWVLQQGRPVDRDWDGDGYLRRTDASVVGDNSRAVPYTDALHFLLANMIGRAPVPSIHSIPPHHGRVSPALLYFGGDDECTPGVQIPASDFMASRHLPYHINAMPRDGRFAFSADEQARIETNGHEIAIHYDFSTGFDHPCGFTRQDVLEQARQFRERFGRDSICGVNHCVRWTGWAEPARWMLEAGNKADNSFFGWTSPPRNPVNTLGFVHGSAFPRRIWEDAEHDNARLDFLEIPITGYEVGYEGETFIPEKVQQALALALRYRLTLEFFYHPVYIAQYPACRQAIDELVRLIDQLPVPPILMGLDRLYHWWTAREQAVIRNARQSGKTITFEIDCTWEDGYVAKIPTGEAPPAECLIDGSPADFETAAEFGQHWAFISLTTGSHKVEICLSNSKMA
jgi:hypothetical protein